MASEVEKFDALKNDWWDLNGKLHTLHKFNQLRVPYIKSYISNLNASILDVGCGGGILSEGLYDTGFTNIIGIDLAPNSIEIATSHAKLGNKNIVYKNIDIYQLEDQFDVVLCLEVVEHVDSLEETLNSIFNKTKDGGLIIISTINKTIRGFFESIIAPEYILGLVNKNTHHFSKLVKPSDITSILNKCKILDIKGVSYSLIDKHFYFRENIDANYFIILQKP